MDTKIILASNSPRRKQIMSALGIDFEVIPSNYDEKLETDTFTYDLIEDLATQKNVLMLLDVWIKIKL